MSENSAKVVVAMSGGVDSSVAAALLIEQGYQVIGMMLRLWSEQGRQIDNRCCTPEAMALARRVAAILSIPFYVVDAKQAHRLAVVQSFTEGYLAGITPNPCLECNRQIRWGLLLDRARALGADYLATGHYARVVQNADGPVQLLKAIDEQKDQSYVLHMFSQQELSQTLLPLGELTKSQVRQKARQLGLPVADRKESQDLCFLAGNDYRDFLSRNAPGANNPGPILDSAGNPLGELPGITLLHDRSTQRSGYNQRQTTVCYFERSPAQRPGCWTTDRVGFGSIIRRSNELGFRLPARTPISGTGKNPLSGKR
ncbi:MAG: tRNA 2-thiouridine(34) synthase MnmA [Anaerolineales bacterium]|nr:tRNA 2-thiouridine(34) synthase MnmA [Anaerolineales bacterium]